VNTIDLVKITGQHLLFLGISSFNWSIAQFQDAARFARSHGVDSLLVKVADGTNMWYGGMNGWHDRRNAILAEGVDAIPYMYSYGDKFGALDAEIDIMIAHLRDNSIMCADMEIEWDGQVGWAQHLTSRVLPVPGTFLVSTWADPSLHSWQGIIRALAPTTTVFMPQQYNNFLATFWQEFAANGAASVQPTVQLTQEFGANDPVAIARNAHNQGHSAISVWYYETAKANPGLLDAVYATFPKGTPMIEQAAQDTWNSTAFLFGSTPLPYNTGIALAWRNLYVNQRTLMPPPTTREFDSVDWNGNRIIVQFFGSTRCEWDPANAQAHWYKAGF
jgi:hypothetical protein